jgi:hypothetical protein
MSWILRIYLYRSPLERSTFGDSRVIWQARQAIETKQFGFSQQFVKHNAMEHFLVNLNGRQKAVCRPTGGSPKLNRICL